MPATPTAIETADLKAFIDARRPRAWALGYPGVVRERVRAYAAARRSAGATVGMIAEELGLSRHSVLAWTRGRREEVRLRPVVVAPDTEPSHRPTSSTAWAPAIVLVSPRGYRVEGLDLPAITALLVAVG